MAFSYATLCPYPFQIYSIISTYNKKIVISNKIIYILITYIFKLNLVPAIELNTISLQAYPIDLGRFSNLGLPLTLLKLSIC